MNKYIKLLALSSGLLAVIAPTAIDTQKDNYNNDLNNTYQSIERIQNIIPKLSKVNYMLNIDIPDDKSSNDAEDTVTFSTTDENGDSTQLSNQETLIYLDSALQQTNAEYEQLKQCLMDAIKDTMDYLDKYKNDETELTNEQKLYIKEHSNSIKFLAETLEDLSEELICVVDGCEDCDEEQFETNVSLYLDAINNLEERINVLQSSLSSLQLINNIANPYFYPRFIPKPNYVNFNDSIIDNNGSNSNDNVTDNNLNDDNLSAEQDNTEIDIDQDSSANISNQENIESDGSVEVEQSTNTADEDEKPTTFGLKSNIDTYAPTKRNIDTFFNTALYNDNYMYGNNYMPYGYGGGYGMPYGNGYMANPYGNGLNSNLVNRNVVENGYANEKCEHCGTANIEADTPETKKTKKFRVKKAKNIDTYTDVTVKSNINTMGESKISKFFKDKFNNLRNKVKNRKENSNQADLIDNVKNGSQDVNTAQDVANNIDNVKNSRDINISDDILVESQIIDKTSITNNSQQPIEENEIKAQ